MSQTPQRLDPTFENVGPQPIRGDEGAPILGPRNRSLERDNLDLPTPPKTDQLYADAEKLHKQLDRFAYGPPPVRFSEEDVNQARAAGVLIEFERGRPTSSTARSIASSSRPRSSAPTATCRPRPRRPPRRSRPPAMTKRRPIP